MKPSNFLRTFLTLMFAALAVAEVRAADPVPSWQAKKIIVAAVEPSYAPFEFKDPATGKLTGFDIELGEALANKLGFKIQWQETSFDQMINSVATKRVDIILSAMADLPSRHSSISFVDYLTTGPQFFTLKTQAKDYPDIAALCGKRVGASKQATFGQHITNWSDANCVKAGKSPIVLLGTNGSADARLQLKQGRIDAAVQGGETLPYLNRIENEPYALIGKIIKQQYSGIGVAKDDTALIAALAGALDGLIADGTYPKMLDKWGLKDHGVNKAQVNAGAN